MLNNIIIIFQWNFKYVKSVKTHRIINLIIGFASWQVYISIECTIHQCSIMQQIRSSYVASFRRATQFLPDSLFAKRWHEISMSQLGIRRRCTTNVHKLMNYRFTWKRLLTRIIPIQVSQHLKLHSVTQLAFLKLIRFKTRLLSAILSTFILFSIL